jgi:hypothetical protein
MLLPSNIREKRSIQHFSGIRDLLNDEPLSEFLPADGDGRNKSWTNYLPITVPGVTAATMKMRTIGENIFEGVPQISLINLLKRSDVLATKGEMNRAFLCLLAGALIHRKRALKKRDVTTELSLLTRALYFLRRGIPFYPELSLEYLKIALEHIQNSLKCGIPDERTQRFSLIELGSWLTEQGHAEKGRWLLDIVKRLNSASDLTSSEYSGFARQMSQSALTSREDKDVLYWINAASNCGDGSAQNACGITIARIQFYILRDDLHKHVDEIYQFFKTFDDLTNFGFKRFDVADIGINIPTALALLGYRSLLAAYFGEECDSFENALEFQEIEGVGKARVTNNSFLIQLFTNRELPLPQAEFLSARVLRRLPPKAAEDIEATAIMLLEAGA